jgi:putative spermidine/putrescine transport system ATP-binding protein
VEGVSLAVAKGEFICLLGPSGCGKTTTLRMIAGFLEPDGGEIRVNGATVSRAGTIVPPERRNMSMIFQSYAVWPHMTVLENVAYGLKMQKRPAAERRERGMAMLAATQLTEHAEKYPAALSGGQQQRVALGRGLVARPKVLLLDEPLGALDLKLREDMQGELKGLHRSLGLTFVFVTHDQGEALSMADRVAVFNEGKIVQVGSPEDVYERPHTRFVADFVGSSNVIEPETTRAWIGEAKAASLRPEKIAIVAGAPPDGAIVIDGKVGEVLYHGATKRIELETAAGHLVAAVPSMTAVDATPGASVRAVFARSALHLMDGA